MVDGGKDDLSDLIVRTPSRRATADSASEPGAALRPAPRSPSEPFIGREAELAALAQGFAARASEHPSVTLVHGPSGIGKSALLRHFVDEICRRNPDVLVLSARCFERENVPFKALDAAIDALARMLRLQPEAAVVELLPRDVAAMVRLFPVLEQVPAMASTSIRLRGDEEPSRMRRRGADALREMLSRISDRRPLLIVVDDLQWGDADSARLLADLVRGPDAPALCFIGALRDGEERSPFIHRFTELRASLELDETVTITELKLGPLADAESRRVLSELLPPDSGSPVLDTLVTDAGGSPFFLVELARAGLDTSAGTVRLDEVLRRRLELLSPAAHTFFEVAAVAARPTAADVLHEAAEGGDLAAVVSELRAARLLRTREEGGIQQLEVYHDRIRELLAAEISGAHRRGLHRSLASAFERRGDDERVAVHLREAGEPRRAAALMAQAARRADGSFAFEHAARLYRDALALHAEAGGLERGPAAQLLRALGQALSAAGRCTEAAEAFLGAAAHSDGIAAVELRRSAAAELLGGGYMIRGRQVVESVLASLRLSLPRSPVRALLSALPLRAWLRLRGIERPLRDPASIPAEELVRLDTLWTLAAGFISVEPVLAVPLMARHALKALELGDPYRVLRALSSEAAGQAIFRGERGHAAAQRCLERAQWLLPRCDQEEAEAFVLLGRISVDFFQGRFVPAMRHIVEAEALAQRQQTRESFEWKAIGLMKVLGLFFMGHIADILRVVPPRLSQLEDQRRALFWSFNSFLYASAISLFPARHKEAEALLETAMSPWAEQGPAMPHYWHMVHCVQLKLAAGDGEGALACFHATWPTLRQQRTVIGPFYRLVVHWLHGRAAVAAAAQDGPERAHRLAEAEHAARRIDALGTSWGRGFSLTVRAGAAAQAGQLRRAEHLLAEAEPLVATLQIDTLLASIRDLRGKIVGGAVGTASCAAAETWRRAQGLPGMECVRNVYLPATLQ